MTEQRNIIVMLTIGKLLDGFISLIGIIVLKYFKGEAL